MGLWSGKREREGENSVQGEFIWVNSGPEKRNVDALADRAGRLAGRTEGRAK